MTGRKLVTLTAATLGAYQTLSMANLKAVALFLKLDKHAKKKADLVVQIIAHLALPATVLQIAALHAAAVNPADPSVMPDLEGAELGGDPELQTEGEKDDEEMEPNLLGGPGVDEEGEEGEEGEEEGEGDDEDALVYNCHYCSEELEEGLPRRCKYARLVNAELGIESAGGCLIVCCDLPACTKKLSAHQSRSCSFNTREKNKL